MDTIPSPYLEKGPIIFGYLVHGGKMTFRDPQESSELLRFGQMSARAMGNGCFTASLLFFDVG